MDMQSATSYPQSPLRGNAKQTDGQLISATIVIKRVLYYSEETQWASCIADVEKASAPTKYKDGSQSREITVAGGLPNAHEGMRLDTSLEHTVDARYGHQYKIVYAMPSLPTDLSSLHRWLRDNIPNVGPVRAKLIIDAFGMDTPTMMAADSAVAQLEEIGIAAGWGKQIVEECRKNRAQMETQLVLLSSGLSSSQCRRALELFGAEEIGVVIKDDPYALMKVRGIGFAGADSVAKRMGMADDHPRRLEAALRHIVDVEAEEGHCYVPRPQAVEKAARLLEQATPTMRSARQLFDGMTAQLAGGRQWGLVAAEGENVWNEDLLDAEVGIASHVQIALASPSAATVNLSEAQWQGVFSHMTNADGNAITLSDEQQGAVKMLADRSFALLVGGPGTGKTTLLTALLAAYGAAGVTNIRVCAPTGKAARRSTEVTGREATTIHRLINLVKQGLVASVIIVDEASMVDVRLMADLLECFGPGVRFLLIGDINQLPSVGPGKVLADLIDADVPTARLTTIYRQAAESKIIQAAYAVNGGDAPDVPLAFGLQADNADLVRLEPQTEADVVKTVVTLVSKEIPAKYGIASEDVRVLVPQRTGGCGVWILNQQLQAVLNPPDRYKTEVKWTTFKDDAREQKFETILREGDRLLWLENDAKLELVNGSEVEVLSIQPGLKVGGRQEPTIIKLLEISENREIEDVWLSQLTAMHAYAMTVHKSQGSEYLCAVVVANKSYSQRVMRRRLLYTAITRAKRRCVLLASTRQLELVAQRNDDDSRRTMLVGRLQLQMGGL